MKIKRLENKVRIELSTDRTREPEDHHYRDVLVNALCRQRAWEQKHGDIEQAQRAQDIINVL